jgi:phage anti-repressor protein
VEQVHGGHNKEKIMMNVDTFKALCMMPNTQKGKQTRRYYSKMESIFFKYIHKTTLANVQNEKQQLEYDLNKQKELDIPAKQKHATSIYTQGS